MLDRASPPPPRFLRRLGWFVLFYAAGVGSVATVALVLRLWLRTI